MEILMPQLGQAMVSGVIVAWHVEDGEQVQAGAPLVTIESDKAAFDIESPATGVVTRNVAAGEEADVGAVLGLITADGVAAGPRPEAVKSSSAAKSRPASNLHARTTDKISASPRARAAARGKIELADVQPSRADGMITVEDVERALAATRTGKTDAAEDRRKAIGAAHRVAISRLQRSWSQAPHIVQVIEVDAASLVDAQKLIKKGALKATLNDVIIKAAADTMAEFPDLNAYIDGDELVYGSEVDVNIAVATERGLRTPSVTSVAGLPLEEVAARSREAVEQAREGRSSMRRASLTVSNLGRYGVKLGTPVLNLDESVLIFVGALTERPRVVSGAIEPGYELLLSIAYDHRIVDGLRAAEFSSALRQRLEQFRFGQVAEHSHVHERAARLKAQGLKCELEDAGGHRWVVDEPRAIGGTDKGPDPVTSVLGGLLSCLTIAFRLIAKRRGVQIDQLEGSISTPDPAKVGRIDVSLNVRSPVNAEKVRALLKPAKQACYVHAMLKPEIELNIGIEIRSSQG